MRISVGHPKWTDDEGNPVEGPKVGDRFYMQQLAATGGAVGSKSKPPKKLNKAELLAKLPSIDGLDKLVMADLETLISWYGKVHLLSHAKPEDKVRLKAPWVACLTDITGLEIGWDKLTVATLKAVYADLTQGME